jgi:ABC-2 type transport system ATP-binding protein
MLILDEPTAGVDIEIRRSMWTFLKELNTQGTTIILTTHYLEEAESLCRNIAIIGQGNIITQGQTKALLKEKNKSTFVADLGEKMTSLPAQLEAFEARLIDENSLEVSLQKGESLNMLFETLSEFNINVSSIRPKTNRLEELFIDLTGSAHGQEANA